MKDKKKTKELDWTDIVKNILFANGVICDSEQFLIEDILSLLTQQRTELLKLVNKAFEETVIESESCDYDFYEKLNNLLNKKDE